MSGMRYIGMVATTGFVLALPILLFTTNIRFLASDTGFLEGAPAPARRGPEHRDHAGRARLCRGRDRAVLRGRRGDAASPGVHGGRGDRAPQRGRDDSHARREEPHANALPGKRGGAGVRVGLRGGRGALVGGTLGTGAGGVRPRRRGCGHRGGRGGRDHRPGRIRERLGAAARDHLHQRLLAARPHQGPAHPDVPGVILGRGDADRGGAGAGGGDGAGRGCGGLPLVHAPAARGRRRTGRRRTGGERTGGRRGGGERTGKGRAGRERTGGRRAGRERTGGRARRRRANRRKTSRTRANRRKTS